MIRDLVAFLRTCCRRRREYSEDHPIRRSRELMTESALRRTISDRLIRQVESRPDPLDLLRQAKERR
jgi:hypothetical protein